MDDNPIYWDAAASGPYRGPVAPPLFPTHMFRRDVGTPDPLRERAGDPDFDGSGATLQGLPEIEPLRAWATLNGGAELEFYRYARHGERVSVRSSYESITEKETSRGPIILVVVLNEYLDADGEILVRQRRTYIRRPPA
jgi:hydroxyacyl-ACP dehydratase HTD2-like protein with hotdog domain